MKERTHPKQRRPCSDRERGKFASLAWWVGAGSPRLHERSHWRPTLPPESSGAGRLIYRALILAGERRMPRCDRRNEAYLVGHRDVDEEGLPRNKTPLEHLGELL